MTKASKAIKISISPLVLVMIINCCSEIKTPARTKDTQMSFSNTASNSLCTNSLVAQRLCQLSRCQVSDSMQVKKQDINILGWHDYALPAAERSVEYSATFSVSGVESL